MITVTCLTSDIGHPWIFDLAVKPLERGNGLPSGSLKHKAVASAASGDACLASSKIDHRPPWRR